jgi:hypothetical protein
MAVSGRSTHIQELLRALAKDWEGLYRRYPDQAIFALNDNRVIEALDKRFREASNLQDIKSLPYDFQTGLNCVYFEFSHASGRIELPSSRSFLVVMGGNCDVVGVIDPFDPDKPNPFMPTLPKVGDQPFVLARPSVTDSLSFSDQELQSNRTRTREYFRRLAEEGGAGIGPGDVEIYTTCNYTTQTPRDYWPDNNRPDDCGGPILA